MLGFPVEDQLWEPNANSDVRALFLDENGKSVGDGVYTRDVMDKAYGLINIYQSFLDKLAEMKTDGNIADYSAVPYDWRLSLDDILSGGVQEDQNGSQTISYLLNTSDPYVVAELRRLVASSQNGKVTIVAHSNGGLLAKALLQKLADTNDPLLAKVDKLVLVAVPQVGTPSSLTGLLQGFDQGIPTSLGPFVSNTVMREFGQNLVGAYNFVPSAAYFTTVATPPVVFDSSLSGLVTTDWISRFGASVTTHSGLYDFLTDTSSKVASTSNDLDTPTALRANLLSQSDATHAVLDSWSPPVGLDVLEIAGWGVPSTVSGVTYSLDTTPVCIDVICSTFSTATSTQVTYEPRFTIDGDGTVVTPSALWLAGAGSVTRYWVNLGLWNKTFNRVANLRLRAIKHPDILEVPELLTFIKNIVISEDPGLPQYLSTSTPIASPDDTRLVYSLRTSGSVDVYDALGRHTGISTTTGLVEENASSTYFVTSGKHTYVFTENDSTDTDTNTNTPTPPNPPHSTHIHISGSSSGSSSSLAVVPETLKLQITKFQGDTPLSTVTLQGVPISSTTQADITVTGDMTDISNISTLVVDTNGDGTVDITLSPILNDVVTYIPPPIPDPVISISNDSIITTATTDSQTQSHTRSHTTSSGSDISETQRTDSSKPAVTNTAVNSQRVKVLFSNRIKESKLNPKPVSVKTKDVKNSKPTVSVTDSDGSSQTAQVISAKQSYITEVVTYIKNFLIHIVDWFLSLFGWKW